MHARHRSPGNGYRSGSMGVGMGASRISPDNSARGHGFYNSEYRSFNNRGFAHGQGHPKSFRQPPPQKGDILMEAGRLAAEYLVSKGLLPQSALSGKWQNGSFKRQAGDYQDFRQQEDLMQEGRTSAHSRLGSGASDAGLGRRRYPDDFNLRNHVKGRRRGEHYRGYSSEWGREYGRSGSLSDRNRMSPDTEENDTVSGHCEEQQVSNDVGDGMEKSGQSGVAPESEETADIESGLSKYNYPNETGSKASSSSVLKEETDGEPSKGSGDPANVNLGNKDMKDGNYDYEIEKQIVPEDLPIQQSDLSGKDESDLLTLSKFANVPTKMRSALSCRSSRVDQVPNNEEEDTSDNGLNKGSEDVVQDGVDNVSATDVNATHDSNCPNSEIIKVAVVQPAEDADEEGLEYGAVEGKCVRSHSFSDGAFMHDNEQESSLGLSGFGRSTSVKERGEKRAAESSGIGEAAKKPREWLSSLVNTADEHLHRTDLSENTGGSQEERASPDQQVTMAVAATQDSDISNCQFPRIAGEPGFKYAEEKQLFPSSFKIVDLNLMETSDINETHCSDPVLTYPSIMTTKREAPQVDIDLSISNSNVSDEYARHMSYGKQVEIIDLENDCTLEDKDFDNSQRKMETAFTGTEGFPSLPQNTGDITDVQVNYDGLMLAEFLNNLSNCTSEPDNITPLQSEMDLDNGEGTLGDDDSIYMSLGEIPLSFIPAWEPPTPQEYEKPF
ncbi:hypothetical protein POPTR_011G169200v4 [Populus trichocarpa]|uniref:Uncharacterized protein n=7 Tax=Populus trichocarpa TaxID=3694 RepID=U5FXF4_POPTR|nr:uncharacterized protein At4g26450 isoform X1 [Populus trichocarpa]XP_006378013.1 uncharacterized protein At4g26450 isoform X1 [Populus trichocarpa]KAI5572232.1 hypothetical protein BDE02_11G148500 [Populus trichocarpa]KAI5572233.1 hypothetical protein BDE02_11G148500 [Populus trichocarpa]KAI5572235.1 hypothetical protein BDE02_11G148500 [Populus trichocarpa]KAI5572236.1 hypothetical protein BDE02_11G148500 [Populus trichocarpa]KAI5572237.1 hypothetical protein BDE02_11G148500 [Populus tric|eukprot:XP_006378012.1 uncharacterized protein At4g26450 isoform X1 [Populus trichocarpa]